MTVSICIGSCCHLNGSYAIKMCFQSLISRYNLEEQVALEVAFCLGRCKEGVTIRVNDEIITGLTPENAENIFHEKVLRVAQTVVS